MNESGRDGRTYPKQDGKSETQNHVEIKGRIEMRFFKLGSLHDGIGNSLIREGLEQNRKDAGKGK
jgi:hypothetical protein